MNDIEENYASTPELSSTRKRILHAATELFLERGYDEVTLDEIVRLARVSKTSIYKVFGSKDDLLHAVVEQSGLDAIGESFADPPGSDIEAKLHAIGVLYLRRFLDPRSLTIMRFCLALAPRFPRIGAYLIENLNHRCSERASTLIAAWAAQGLTDIKDADEAAIIFLQLLRSRHQLEALCDPNYQAKHEQIEDDVSSAVKTLLVILASAKAV